MGEINFWSFLTQASQVFHLFDRTMVLRSGKLFYFGSLPGLSESLHSAGKGCPNEFNLADHVMFVLQTESGDNGRRIVSAQ